MWLFSSFHQETVNTVSTVSVIPFDKNCPVSLQTRTDHLGLTHRDEPVPLQRVPLKNTCIAKDNDS